ncbi:MAG: HEPN domain-containing protein [Anaerolineales bacterium]|nr:HEPN domain-containing protein [Anaerolineales bacterium]
MTDYAVTSRYPGDYEEIDRKEYLEAVRLAQVILDWAERVVSQNL